MSISKNKRESLPMGMLSISDVSRLLNVHPNTIRAWSNKGLLKAYRLGYRRDRRFRQQDIDSFLRNGDTLEAGKSKLQ